MSKLYFLIFLFTLLIKCDSNQSVIERVLNKDIQELQKILKNKEEHEIQILLS